MKNSVIFPLIFREQDCFVLLFCYCSQAPEVWFLIRICNICQKKKNVSNDISIVNLPAKFAL